MQAAPATLAEAWPAGRYRNPGTAADPDEARQSRAASLLPLLNLTFIALPPAVDAHGGHHWLLIRRNRRTRELAFYRCWSPDPVPLTQLVTVAGRRRKIEESFQAAKTGLGLDQHQVRRWTSWHRWTTLAILATPSSPPRPLLTATVTTRPS